MHFGIFEHANWLIYSRIFEHHIVPAVPDTETASQQNIGIFSHVMMQNHWLEFGMIWVHPVLSDVLQQY